MASRYKMDYLLNDLKDKRNTREYYLIDRKGYRFRIVDDYNSNIIFLGSKKICNLFDLPQFIAGGICNFYIDARTLGLSEIKTVVKFYRNAVDKILDKKMVEFNRIAESAGKNLIFSDYTRGHFYRGIV